MHVDLIQPQRIHLIDGIPAHIQRRIRPIRKAQRIRGKESAGIRVVITMVIVIQMGSPVLPLAGQVFEIQVCISL